LVLLAEAYATVGQPEAGLAALDEALAQMGATGERFYEAEVYRCRGHRVQQAAGDMQNVAAVESCFRQALALARRQQTKSLELRAAMSLARLWQRQGKRADARQLLEEVYGWFTEGFDTADLQEARALLGRLT
jgi:predicted ATPase